MDAEIQNLTVCIKSDKNGKERRISIQNRFYFKVNTGCIPSAILPVLLSFSGLVTFYDHSACAESHLLASRESLMMMSLEEIEKMPFLSFSEQENNKEQKTGQF